MGTLPERLSPSEHRVRLRYGLVGARVTLYQQSPTFKAQIDALAHLLEPMIDGLAAAAGQADEHHLAQFARMQMIAFDPAAVERLRDELGLSPDSEKLDRAARDTSSPAGG